MKAHKHIAAYRRMRSQPLWRLLASVNGPTVIALLQSQLYDKERRLPASILFERLTRDLETLRAQGDDFPQTAQAYVAGWLGDGYLERRFPPGASEEEYELSSAAVEAIRFLSALAEPHSAATESRLSLVIQALVGLAEDTDADKSRRIERLRSLSQWALYDPALQSPPEAMRGGDPPPVDLHSVSALVAQSEIDFRSLKAQVCAVLEQRDQASIGDVLERFPAAQGLGSVLGLLALGSRHGIKGAAGAGAGASGDRTSAWSRSGLPGMLPGKPCSG